MCLERGAGTLYSSGDWASLMVQIVKNPPAMHETQFDLCGSGRAPGEGNGNPFQYSCLENPMTEEPGGIEFMGSQKVRLSD